MTSPGATLRLAGKSIVIAGGGTGIGAGTALRLAAEGASVIVGDLSQSHADQTADRIAGAGGHAIGMAFDMTDEPSIAALLAAAVTQFGGLDGIHINAADMAAHRHDLDALTTDLATFDRIIAVNLRGHLLCTRHAIPHLLARGGGAIVYTTSPAAFLGEPRRVSYAISKAGLNALMRHVASKWGKQNIRANAVAPGMIRTPANDASPPERFERALAATRSPRLGQPGDIGAMVAMLMSADGEWINGQVISVDGGATIR